MRTFALLLLLVPVCKTFGATENVILITLDGLRWQEVFQGADRRLINRNSGVKLPAETTKRFWSESVQERRTRLMPFFWNTIVKRGQVFGDPSVSSIAKATNGLYFSYPGYNEILSGGPDRSITSNAKVNNRNVTVLEWFQRKPEYRGKVAAFASWDVFPYIVNAKRSGIYVNAGWQKLDVFRDPAKLQAFNLMTGSLPRYWPNVRYDIFTFRGALEYLHVKKPRLLYIALGETDDWAHSNRYDLYLDAAYRNDQYIRQLWEAIQQSPHYAGRTSLVITTDHGRGSGREGWKSHGVAYPGSDRIWVACLGPDVPAQGIRKNVNVKQSQIAGTVAKLLGEARVPAKWATALPISGLTNGPIIGHVTETQAFIWARYSGQAKLTLVARSAAGQPTKATAAATRARDGCVTWKLTGLRPATRYSYEVFHNGRKVTGGQQHHFTTTGSEGRAVRLAFGSCAREDKGSSAVWRQMEKTDPHAVVLLGDTPYIDSTKLARQRQRHRQFLSVSSLNQLLRSRPLYATWDDHDFGRNDTNGKLPGKELSRQAFMEYHANPSYGDGKQGIYTRFRRGPVEVFLLDTRYFAATETSPFDRTRPTLLGRKQWRWLFDGLKKSTAPFKVLACGMIWNGAVRPGKQDHWGTYPHERKALFTYIGRQQISGVVLVGGDVHRSRLLLHPSQVTAGYRIPELITSPIHDGVIERANSPHPGLVFDAGIGNSYLLLTASKDSLQAKFLHSSGRVIYEKGISRGELQRP